MQSCMLACVLHICCPHRECCMCIACCIVCLLHVCCILRFSFVCRMHAAAVQCAPVCCMLHLCCVLYVYCMFACISHVCMYVACLHVCCILTFMLHVLPVALPSHRIQAACCDVALPAACNYIRPVTEVCGSDVCQWPWDDWLDL